MQSKFTDPRRSFTQNRAWQVLIWPEKMYMCMYLYMYMYVYIYMCVFMCICMRMCMSTRMCMYMCMCMYMYESGYEYVHECVYQYVYVCRCVCARTCVCVGDWCATYASKAASLHNVPIRKENGIPREPITPILNEIPLAQRRYSQNL